MNPKEAWVLIGLEKPKIKFKPSLGRKVLHVQDGFWFDCSLNWEPFSASSFCGCFSRFMRFGSGSSALSGCVAS